MNYKCDQLAGAVVMHKRFESGSKLRALQTLRAIRLRTGMSALRNQCGCPEGTHDNSPALQCWGEGASRKYLSPGGTAEACASRMRLAPNQPSLRDSADPSQRIPNAEALGYCQFVPSGQASRRFVTNVWRWRPSLQRGVAGKSLPRSVARATKLPYGSNSAFVGQYGHRPKAFRLNK